MAHWTQFQPAVLKILRRVIEPKSALAAKTLAEGIPSLS
jgi:hypothetical protein